MKKIILNTAVLFHLLLLNSCREEIIQPDNISGNINQPTRITEFNLYTFIINAYHANFTLTEATSFAFDKVNLIMTNIDYGNGVVKLNILNDESISYFEYFINEELDSRIVSVEGFIPSSIKIQLTDFTGKLKVQLSPY